MSDFSPAMDSFPREVTLNPILGMTLMAGTHFPMQAINPDVKPSDRQRNIKPGDFCLVALSNSLANHDVVIAEVQNPEEYSDQFPNWEERVMRSFVLTSWKADEDFEGGLGWYDLTRMVPIAPEQYQEILGLLEKVQEKDEKPDLPKWMHDLYARHLEELNELAPDVVAKLVRCPNCEGTEVEIHGTKVVRIRASAATKKNGNKTVYGLGGEPEINHAMDVHLHCSDCRYKGLLGEDEWSMDEGLL